MTAQSESSDLECRACPNGCTDPGQPVISACDRLHGVPGRFTVLRCNACGLMRTDPRPTPDRMGAYYPSNYGPYQMQDGGSTQPIVRSGFKQLLRRVMGLDARSMPPIPPGRLLELGCSNGAFMEQMRQLGWDAEGIEFSEVAAQQARARGFRVQSGSVETAQPPEAPIDVVAAWMVLEHLHEPVQVLRRLRQWVRPEGYLVASVPDAGALERRLFGSRWYALQLPTHLYHYTPDSLGRVLATAGWQITRVQWQRNCNNLLWSLEYLALDKGMQSLVWAARWLRCAKAASKLRILMGWLLALMRQSGRIEVWARPLPRHDAVSP